MSLFFGSSNERMRSGEILLSNEAFVRMANNFELYQKLFQANDDKDARLELTNKMEELYTPDISFVGEKSKNLSPIEKHLNEHTNIIASILIDCQKNKFKKENFANKIAKSPLADKYFDTWNGKLQSEDELDTRHHINEVIAYTFENDENISLHIKATNVKSMDLASKIIEGFQKIAEALESGEIKAENILLKSWLLNSNMEKKARLLLGDDINIENTDQNNSIVREIQHLALQYNSKSFEKYMMTGEKPEVKQVMMTKTEFIRRYNSIRK